ncbi:CsbD family protein [Mycolicibacterium llatzerense]|uniref:CsbD family protein n=1 Tax=Mycolicibacterium llatzerense TaxID=280871 RepID=UPI0009E4FD49|nr:CsbD family protein [Mycolicibacterium llatzerense]
MSITRTMANKAEAAKGALKKFIGQSTGNTRLRTEGRVEQFKGNAKQAGSHIKNAFKP